MIHITDLITFASFFVNWFFKQSHTFLDIKLLFKMFALALAIPIEFNMKNKICLFSTTYIFNIVEKMLYGVFFQPEDNYSTITMELFKFNVYLARFTCDNAKYHSHKVTIFQLNPNLLLMLLWHLDAKASRMCMKIIIILLMLKKKTVNYLDSA